MVLQFKVDLLFKMTARTDSLELPDYTRIVRLAVDPLSQAQRHLSSIFRVVITSRSKRAN